jgi:hypothetical protein
MPDASDNSTAPTKFFWLSVPFLSGMAALVTVVVAITGIILPNYLCGTNQAQRLHRAIQRCFARDS